jgi:hypothetical protein
MAASLRLRRCVRLRYLLFRAHDKQGRKVESEKRGSCGMRSKPRKVDATSSEMMIARRIPATILVRPRSRRPQQFT